MAKNTKAINKKMAWSIVAVLVVLGVLIWKKDAISKVLGLKSSAPSAPSPNSGTKSSTTGNAVNMTIDRSKVLKMNDTGASVKELQRLLNIHHKNNGGGGVLVMDLLVEDGVFGQKTEAMLEHYTKSKTMSIDALVSMLALKVV